MTTPFSHLFRSMSQAFEMSERVQSGQSIERAYKRVYGNSRK
ncbi:MAG: hypothetical protein RLZ98_3503 [Pseudomonadota bacterium]|jgi:hypothetical protein